MRGIGTKGTPEGLSGMASMLVALDMLHYRYNESNKDPCCKGLLEAGPARVVRRWASDLGRSMYCRAVHWLDLIRWREVARPLPFYESRLSISLY